jgi:protocatechuate 3,4-dioxygenase, alpha subunit
MTAFKQTPSQTVGPYFAYGLCPEQYNFDFKSLFTAAVADYEAAGEHISIVGQVFDGDGKVVGDAMLEVSQLDSQGKYPASREEIAASGFRGFARVGTGTDPQKRFIVETVKPGRASESEAPHLNVILTMRGMLLHTFTRIYFDDEAAANESDPVLGSVPAERRATLIARRVPGTSKTVYRFDIHMQGEQETVFFDL